MPAAIAEKPLRAQRHKRTVSTSGCRKGRSASSSLRSTQNQTLTVISTGATNAVM